MKKVALVVPGILLVATAAYADFVARIHVDGVNATYVSQECGPEVRISASDTNLKATMTGADRTSNDWGLLGQTIRGEALNLQVRYKQLQADGSCRTVGIENFPLGGAESFLTFTDGTTQDQSLCYDESGVITARHCGVDGMMLENKKATIVGNYTLPSGHTIDVDLTINQTTTPVTTFNAEWNPAILRIESTSVDGWTGAPVVVSINDQSGDWAILHERYVQNTYVATSTGTIAVDGQALVLDNAELTNVDVAEKAPLDVRLVTP